MQVKNKSHSFIAAFVVVLLVFQTFMPGVIFAAQSSQAPQSSFDISFNNDGTATITGYKEKYNQSYTSVVIPSEINGVKVTEIGDGAFSKAVFLQSIRIPDTIRRIGKESFYQCMSLKEVTIPGSVQKIDTLAFSFCKALERVYILFGVNSIGDGAFANCTSLSSVSISPSTTSIANKSFNDCKSVQIQAKSDSTAGQYKGSQNNTTSAQLPADSPSAYKYSIDEDTGEVIIDEYVGECATPIIPDKINYMNVTKIGDGAFENEPITQITLPSTLRTIGSNAFAGTNLTIVEIPSNVTGIGKGAFNDDASVTLKGDTSAIDEYLFDSVNIKFIPWGPGRTKFHEVTFDSKPAFGGVILQGRSKEYKEGTIITIEAKPFTPYNGGSSAEKGTYLFNGWTLSSNTTDENSLDSIIKNKEFTKTTIEMPSYDIKVTANYKLMPANPLVIKNGVVISYTGNGTEELEIHETWKEFESGESETVHTIGSLSENNGEVFLDPNMKRLILPRTIKTILSVAFKRASGLESISVAEDNENYKTYDGVLFNKDMTKLLAYPQNKSGSTYTVPDTVTEIGEYAFYGNRNLQSINLNNVKRIKAHAFDSAHNLKKIELTQSVSEIESYAFAYIYSLESIHISSSLTSLGERAFSACIKLKNVTWDANCQLSTIPNYAFSNCALSDINLPAGVANVSDYAFYSCNSLKYVNIPSTVTQWNSSALSGCNNLIRISVDDDNTNYSSVNGVLFNKDKSVLMTYPAGKTETDSTYNVPEEVVEIASGAFVNSKFENIVMPDCVTKIGSMGFYNAKINSINLENITEIGSNAFSGCDNLTEVTWPAKVNVLPTSIFNSCNNLETVIIPDTVTEINDYSFYLCTSLKNIQLPSSLKTIGRYAFLNCSSLDNIILPPSLEKIGKYAFSNCSGLTSITIPESVKTLDSYIFNNCLGLTEVNINSNSVGSYMFNGCENIANLTLSENVGSIGSHAFYNCENINSVTFPKSVSSIGQYAFYNCDKLTSLVLPENIKTISYDAFSSCSSLKDVTIGAESIGSYVFYNCNALENVTLLNTVNNIGEYAFRYCHKLVNVSIPESVTSIGYKAFNNCDYLESIEVDENNSNYASVDGVLFNKNKTELILYPENKTGTEYRVIDSVNKVLNYAFQSNNNLTDVYFGENVNYLGWSVFNSASVIKNITIENKNVEFDETGVNPLQTFFYGINKNLLKSLVVHGYIGSTAERKVFEHRIDGIKFSMLDKVTEGLIIQKIEKDSNQVTADNLPLDDKTWLGKLVGYEVPSITLEGADNVVIPSLVTSDMEGLIIKDVNGDIITLGEGESIVVSSIGSHALWYPTTISPSEGSQVDRFVTTIKSVALPQTITEIESGAFEECEGLSNINIPVSVQKIQPYAFKNCKLLTEVTIPKNVAILGDNRIMDEASKTEVYTSVFKGCKNLRKINVEEGNRKYSSVDGVLMNLDKTVIYEVPNGFAGNVSGNTFKYIIPNGVETIMSSAFAQCNLDYVELPGTIKHIGVNAFNGALKNANSEVMFKNSSVGVDIDNEAFSDCTGLIKITLPLELERIGDDVFSGCKSLEEIIIPDGADNFKTIDGVLFGYNIKEDSTENDGVSSSYALLIYPMGKTDATYEVPATEIPIYEIYNSAFQSNNHLESFVCSDNLLVIRESAFRGCTNLNSVTFKRGLNEIEPFAFSDTGLTDVIIPENVSKIGEEAFSNCSFLNSVEIYNKNAEIKGNVFNNHKSDFVLKGFEGSTAEQYANDNGLNFELLTVSNTRNALYSVSASDDISNGSISFDDVQTAEEGDIINVTVTPDEGYRLVDGSLKYDETEINVDDNEVYSFEMPEKNVIVTAEFELISENEEDFENEDSNIVKDNNDSENQEDLDAAEESNGSDNNEEDTEIIQQEDSEDEENFDNEQSEQEDLEAAL